MTGTLPTGQPIISIDSLHALLVYLDTQTRIYKYTPAVMGGAKGHIDRMYHPRIRNITLRELEGLIMRSRLYVEKP